MESCLDCLEMGVTKLSTPAFQSVGRFWKLRRFLLTEQCRGPSSQSDLPSSIIRLEV